MISPDTLLYIYEVRDDACSGLDFPPPSYIGLWNEEEFAYLFFTQPEDTLVRDIVCGGNRDLFSRHEMKYKDWQVGLPSHGITLGGIHFVAPDHDSAPSGSLILDPSVVFGDGNHPTTAGCLQFMKEITSAHRVESMLDLGTGTGILALAGTAMGVGHIVAVDKNLLAISTARQNVRANSLSSVIDVYEGEARLFIDKPFDLIVANLPFHVLRDLLPLSDTALHKHWIVSGINEEQAGVLKDLFLDQGYLFQHQRADAPWVTFRVVNQRYAG